MRFFLSVSQRSGVNFFAFKKLPKVPASWIFANAPFFNSPPFICVRVSALLPSMMMWRTFIFCFLSTFTSKMTCPLLATSSRCVMLISAFLNPLSSK